MITQPKQFKSFVPSPYQVAIFEWAQNNSSTFVDVVIAGGKSKTITAAFVDAVAGSGKTSTLVEMSKLLNTPDALFVAFNVNIVKELQSRLGPGFTATTINSLGNRALMKGLKGYKGFCPIAGRKYNTILFSLIKDMGIEKKDIYVTISRLENFISKGMAELSDWTDESLMAVADHFGLEFPKKWDVIETFNTVRAAVSIGEKQAEAGIINFDEQIYLPVKWGMRPVQASFVMVDEAQDLSKAKLELVLMAVKPGGRFLAVGDPKQSIYGFAGADAGAVDNIIARTQAVVLPLSVSYRCAKTIVEHAQELVPHIEASETAPEGCVEWIKEADLLRDVKANNLVLCRLTAPLVSLCIRLIKNKIPARVKGKDIAKQLINVAKDALNGRYAFSQLNEALDDYLNTQVTILLERPNYEKAIQALGDRVAGVRVCVEGFHAKSLEEFERLMNDLFIGDDEKVPNIVELSTIHRSKGLEADDVYIISPSKLPLMWKGQLPWEAIQESNLDYVARTRAKLRLRYVEEDSLVDVEVA